MMTGKTDRFFITPRVNKEVLYHDMSRAQKELGPSYGYMSSSLVEGADLSIAVREIRHVPPDFKPFIEPHKHDVSQFYGTVGNLTIEVMVESDIHEVKGPVGIFIPPGVVHTIRPVKGKGYLIAVSRSGEYK